MEQTVSTIRGPKWFRGATRLLDGVAGLFQAACEALLVVMLVINSANIVLRNIGQNSLLWVAPWTQVLMVWAVFLAFYVMYRRNLDIALMILVGRFGHVGLKLSRLLTAFAGLLVVCILLAEVPQILLRQTGTMEVVGLTRWSLSIPLIASAFMLSLHFIFDLIALAKGWASDLNPGDEEAMQW